MVCQSIAVPDACGVEQKGVKNVLIYVSAFIIYKQTHTVELKYILRDFFFAPFCNEYFVFYAFDPPTRLPCVKEVRQRDTQISWQRKRLPEVPKSPPTVLPADLQTISARKTKLNCHNQLEK